MIAVVGMVGVGCANDEAAPKPTTTSSAPATTSTAPVASTATTATTLPPLQPGQEELWVFDLTTGDCFDERIHTETGEEVRTIVKSSCDEAHDNEVFAVVQFSDPAGAMYPGNSALQARGDRECLRRFERFVGIDYVVSELEVGTILPTFEGWANGDRDLSCLVFDPDGEKLDASMRGAKR